MDGQRLFIGVQPGGIVYCDRLSIVEGDYQRIAFLPFRSLEPRFEEECPEELRKEVRKNMDAIVAMRGQPYQVSSSGQTVILGG